MTTAAGNNVRSASVPIIADRAFPRAANKAETSSDQLAGTGMASAPSPKERSDQTPGRVLLQDCDPYGDKALGERSSLEGARPVYQCRTRQRRASRRPLSVSGGV